LLIIHFVIFYIFLLYLSEDNIHHSRKSAPDATGDECYAVIDYCPRNLVQMTSTEGMTNLPVKFTSDGGRNLVLLTMLQNHEKKTVEMVRPREQKARTWTDPHLEEIHTL
jgi:hypothetical protein